MKLKSRLIGIASVGLIVAFASSNAFAQAVTVGRGAPATGTVSAPASGPWSSNNVTATRPFGSIDVTTAGTSSDSVRTWTQGRSASERMELNGRCRVINDPTNTARYAANAHQFCRNYMTVGQANPPAGKAPTGKY